MSEEKNIKLNFVYVSRHPKTNIVKPLEDNQFKLVVFPHEKIWRLHNTFGICYNQAEAIAIWVLLMLNFLKIAYRKNHSKTMWIYIFCLPSLLKKIFRIPIALLMFCVFQFFCVVCNYFSLSHLRGLSVGYNSEAFISENSISSRQWSAPLSSYPSI